MRPLVFDLRHATVHYPGVGSYAAGLAQALIAERPDWPWRVLMPVGDGRFDLSFVPEAMRVTARGAGGVVAARGAGGAAPARDRAGAHPGGSNGSRAPSPFIGQWALGRTLRSLDAALYHSPYLLRPWGAQCPSIVTVHDVIPLEHPTGMSAPRRAAYCWLVRDALRATRLITDSAASRDSIRAAFRNRFASARASDPLVVYPGVRIEDRGEPWPPWPRPALLAVGINKPHKNLETLVRALALIPRERRPLLLCAGPEDRRYSTATALAARHGVADDVRALGMVPEGRLAALYRSATLFAFPTRIEGFGLPLLEAMTLGVPAIASDLPVLREIAGDAAWLTPANDAQAWAQAIETLLGDELRRTSMAQHGMEQARRFSYAEAARALIREYEALVPELAGGGERTPRGDVRTRDTHPNSTTVPPVQPRP